MLVIRCKNCGMTLEEHPTKLKSCGCENYTSIRGTNISGKNLSLVEIITGIQKESKTYLSNSDLAYQEERKKRKVKKLDFEVK